MLPSGLSEEIDDREELARFLTSKSQFNSIMVKPAALLPNPKDRETSVSRHGREPKEGLWELGLPAAGDRNLYGAAIFRAKSVRDATLDVIASEPPLRHAVIIGWPWLDDPEQQKAKQKELAAALASSAGPPCLR